MPTAPPGYLDFPTALLLLNDVLAPNGKATWPRVPRSLDKALISLIGGDFSIRYTNAMVKLNKLM